MRTKLTPLVAAAMLASPAAAQKEPTRLHELFGQYDQWILDEFPEVAMARGDYSDADRVTDRSLAAIERRREQRQRFLDKLLLIDPAALRPEDRLNRELFELQLSNDVESYRYRMYLAAIGGREGLHQDIPEMARRVRFRDAGDYADYLARLAQVPRLVRETIEVLRTGLGEGRTAPQVTLAGIPAQFDAILGGGLDALREPFDEMPSTIAPPDAEALRRRFDQEVLPAVRGAVRQLREFVVNEYLPGCRVTIAAADLPDGEAYYAFQLRAMTTTRLSAAEIHEIGMREVARVRGEMMAVIRASDFLEKHPARRADGDDALFAAFLTYLRTDPRFYHSTAEGLLTGYRDICKRVDAWLPRLFSRLPRLPYGVRAIPAFMAPTQTTAWYQRGDIRNAEPGWFYANTYALDQRPKYEMIPLALHEAVPGHHLQVALAQELPDLPEFRRDSYFDAFGEGWALYSERLGIEMDLYGDPYDDFGRLLYEMWRSCRLVVDTGMHAMRWPRDRAIQYMLGNTALSRLNITNEIDRYISWPGQACAYKIGELKIRELRARAEERLGDKFDLRAFHDVVLGAGSIPLTTLEDRVDYWINVQTIRTYD